MRWSIEELDDFWRSIHDFFAVDSGPVAGPALVERRMPGARWFPEARLNWAEHLLRLEGRAEEDVVIVG
ncbi:MAG TPA: acetoacetate--CoA ligase, partial [Micromonosporaceae bacterium]